MKLLAIHAEAEAEVEAAIAYYEAQRAGLGREFRLEFESIVERIRATPQLFAVFDDRGSRKMRFSRFPYTVYFAELDDVIWIAAVAHQKRRPSYWIDRRSD